MTTNYSNANEQFNAELDNFKAGTHKGVLHLGKPLEILKAAGLKEGEISITQNTLTEHLKGHNITVDNLKGLAEEIQRPMLGYNWGKNYPATTILTELTLDDDRKIAVGIRLNNKSNNLSVNEIATIHGKTNNRFLEDFFKTTPEELQNEKLKWVENEKMLNRLGMVPPKGTTQTNSTHFSIALCANCVQIKTNSATYNSL
ncbi:MAG: hypothetical protein LBK47_09215 [Prevotellaceae bacterium]|jgi:hypothetical protein|nr:hypothetical protein [Prevotellaceae bacterium]